MNHDFKIGSLYKVLVPYSTFIKDVDSKNLYINDLKYLNNINEHINIEFFKFGSQIAVNKTFMVLGTEYYDKCSIHHSIHFAVTFLIGLLNKNNENYIFYSLLFINDINYNFKTKTKLIK